MLRWNSPNWRRWHRIKWRWRRYAAELRRLYPNT